MLSIMDGNITICTKNKLDVGADTRKRKLHIEME